MSASGERVVVGVPRPKSGLALSFATMSELPGRINLAYRVSELAESFRRQGRFPIGQGYPPLRGWKPRLQKGRFDILNRSGIPR
jgi:hypothetical protein